MSAPPSAESSDLYTIIYLYSIQRSCLSVSNPIRIPGGPRGTSEAAGIRHVPRWPSLPRPAGPLKQLVQLRPGWVEGEDRKPRIFSL